MPNQAKTANTHQPSKRDMEELIVVNGTPEEIAAAVLRGGADRKEPTNPDSAKRSGT